MRPQGDCDTRHFWTGRLACVRVESHVSTCTCCRHGPGTATSPPSQKPTGGRLRRWLDSHQLPCMAAHEGQQHEAGQHLLVGGGATQPRAYHGAVFDLLVGDEEEAGSNVQAAAVEGEVFMTILGLPHDIFLHSVRPDSSWIGSDWYSRTIPGLARKPGLDPFLACIASYPFGSPLRTCARTRLVTSTLA